MAESGNRTRNLKRGKLGCILNFWPKTPESFGTPKSNTIDANLLELPLATAGEADHLGPGPCPDLVLRIARPASWRAVVPCACHRDRVTAGRHVEPHVWSADKERPVRDRSVGQVGDMCSIDCIVI